MGRRLILGVGQRGKLAGRRMAESGYSIEAVGCVFAAVERVVSDQNELPFAIELRCLLDGPLILTEVDPHANNPTMH